MSSRASLGLILSNNSLTFCPLCINFFMKSLNISLYQKIVYEKNSLEFIQSPQEENCAFLRIIHQTSCTSQSTNVLECNQHCLLNMTHTLMVEIGDPHYFWSNAITTTIYLLKNLHSSSLGDEVLKILTLIFPSYR